MSKVLVDAIVYGNFVFTGLSVLVVSLNSSLIDDDIICLQK